MALSSRLACYPYHTDYKSIFVNKQFYTIHFHRMSFYT